MKGHLTFLLCFFVCFSTRAQLSTNEEPISFKRSVEIDTNCQVDTKTMPSLDMEAITKEDLEDEEYGYPPRFGYSHKVEYNLQNSGTWQELPNGDKLWQLVISCPNAVSINLLYDKFWIPDGGKLFIYTPDKKQCIGAFTSQNNKGDENNIQGFATDILYGDEIILEYFQSKEVVPNAVISISNVVHGYRYMSFLSSGYYSSGDCHVNVNCSEGNDWQNEKRAVAMILVNGNRYCTGSLIKSTSNDFRPLFLTADPCLGGWANEEYVGINGFKYDAINCPTLNHWTFWWNYEASGCNSPTNEPGHISTTGATILANNSYSDFALLELSEDPLSKNNYIPYYLGWDRSGNSGTGGVGIHHPSGDAKKISTYSMTPISSNYLNYIENNNGSHWRVNWIQTSHGHGTTEEGSSGSPLLNANHRVIGQLHGGDSRCSNLSGLDWYGKFNESWTGNGNSDNRRRLNHWLNPSGGYTILDGSYPFSINGPSIVCSSAAYSVNHIKSGCSVTWSFKNASSLNSLIQQNSPSANQCTITPGSTNIDNTLVATIWNGGTALCTVEKDIMTPKSLTGTIHQEGQYYYGRNYPSFTIGMESIFAVNQVCQITLQSPKFKHMNFSTTTNPSASVSLQRINDETIKFSVSLSTTNVDLRIYGTNNGSCNDFELRVLAMKNPIDPSNPFYINMSGNTIELELNQAMMRDLNGDDIDADNITSQAWTLDVYEATTGRKVYTEQVEGNRQGIDTSSWSPGIYVVYGIINGRTYSTKMTVK